MSYRLLQNIGNINEQLFFRYELKNYTLCKSVETLIFSDSFIKEFNKPKKSEFIQMFIKTVFRDYWWTCWEHLTISDKPCGLPNNKVKLIIKYVEYCFNCKGTFRLESTEIKREWKKEINGSKSISNWNGERFVDVCVSK